MMTKFKTIDTATFKDVHASDAPFVIDVRTAGEYKGVHVDGAHLFPLQDLKPESVEKARIAAGKEDGPVYVLCKGGQRAEMAAKQLCDDVKCDVIVVEGGTDACVTAGMPVNRGQGVMSLERQVRIAAGFLVLTGVLLGTFVAPGFYGLSGFVGAGLMFAGITNTCAMGMLIAKMPWNNA
ncbi:sulfurtransferase [Kordiimonas sediminis]|uniref:Sulfurtransferase n=1 Tax=Kordiimonas sediminis TaxID=1735581 RepID=A0A919AR26_9PROT|nr:rhodanese-like domain-containing protein [Kordiimonas sediminis]GHF20656.1 sulfurtransferase [Kordiimonas sediminis]